jgi:hypothetical protein
VKAGALDQGVATLTGISPVLLLLDNIWNAYIRVDDVESVYREVHERSAGIDYTIYNAPSGVRRVRRRGSRRP